MERPAQRRAIKRQRSVLESGTEESSAENAYGSAELETPIDVALDDLTRMHEGFAEPSCIRDAFTLQLLGVIGMMARQIKELKAGGDTQSTSLVRSVTKKVKVERTPFEQQLTDIAKVRTRNYDSPLISYRADRLEHTLLSSVCLTSGRPPKKRYRQ